MIDRQETRILESKFFFYLDRNFGKAKKNRGKKTEKRNLLTGDFNQIFSPVEREREREREREGERERERECVCVCVCEIFHLIFFSWSFYFFSSFFLQIIKFHFIFRVLKKLFLFSFWKLDIFTEDFLRLLSISITFTPVQKKVFHIQEEKKIQGKKK